MQELEKILEEIEAEHPYKVPGNYDSYSQYNEAWSDAIDRVRARMENLLSRENAPEITRSSRDNEVTECCPHCDSEITVLWNVEQDGYQIFCPNCGETIMLCSMCDREP